MTSAWQRLQQLALQGLWLALCLGLLPKTSAAQANAAPVVVSGESAFRWTEDQAQFWLLSGRCVVRHHTWMASANRGLLLVQPLQGGGYQAKVYLEDQVQVEGRGFSQPGTFEFAQVPDVEFHTQEVTQRKIQSELVQRAFAAWAPQGQGPPIHTVQQRTVPELPPQQRLNPEPVPAPRRRLPFRRFLALPVNGNGFQLESRPSGIEGEQVTVLSEGVNLIIEGITEEGLADQLGTVDITAERIVIWSQGGLDLQGETSVDSEIPVEVYMEGDIKFRSGERVIFADRMYYNVTREVGIILGAELRTPVPDVDGIVRVNAPVLRQIAPNQYLAQEAWFSTSLLGRPTYRWQAGEIFIEDLQRPLINPVTGAPLVNPQTGGQVTERAQILSARRNRFYLGEIPVFYWPAITTELEDFDVFVNKLQFRNDNIFGTQVRVGVDLYEAFGLEPLPNSRWDLNIDYLSERGLGHGTFFSYGGDRVFDIPGDYVGFIDYWGISDEGLDNLGSDRRAVLPGEDYRYRLFGRHRHYLPNDLRLTGEVGWISDRNFLEQYYETEWDNNKDATTGIELKQLNGNRAWSLWTDVQANDFFTQTEWLPRFNHYWLGQPLLGNRVTWFEHTSVAYARTNPASAPVDPQEQAIFQLRPFEVPGEGERFVTTHELNAPAQLGPVKVVPYTLGQFGHWGEAIDGTSLDRFYGQVGARASLSAWALYPEVENNLLNLQGMAHKVTFESEAYYADANRSVTELQLYDPLDDDNIEQFRRRFQFNTFNGTIPAEFDERFYAIRAGLPGSVTNPAAEVADDLQVVRMNVNQRWQTKRGRPGRQKIVDWISLDTGISYFPDTSQNFGEPFGLANYDFRWQLGNRLSLFSLGVFDFFGDGQRIVQVGAALERPSRGLLRVGFMSLEGPISSEVLSLSYDYRMTEKWAANYGVNIDFGPGGNIGQNLGLTRIGESFIMTAGFTYNESKDNFGIRLNIEPRFLARNRRIAGERIGTAGVDFLQ